MERTKKIPLVQMVLIDFDSLARQSEQEIVSRFIFYWRNTKGLFKEKAVRCDGFRVFKQPQALIIDLMLGEERTAQFSFHPPPDFSRMHVMT
jgi:hypothetical protein